MNDTAPQRLGDFEITREIGRGGMGVVYEARQVSLNRLVALKVLGGGLGLTGKAVLRFRREAEAAARLHHTNIVPVYATGEADGAHFYAMELIDGPSLDRVIRQLRRTKETEKESETKTPSVEGVVPANLEATGPYVPRTDGVTSEAGLSSSSFSSGSGYFDTVARLMAEVADALAYAHQQGVIHRDIKPSNLLLAPAGRLSVNDFGLARMLEQPGMTMTGEFVGTPKYMSPEQITAGRTPIDHRTDIYSLGATLYELLTLHPPFRGERRDQILAQIMHKEPKAPRKVNAKVPVDLETICLKALEKDPDRRYQKAEELADDLRRYLNRFAISARRAGPVQRMVKWVRRRPLPAAALASAFLLALVAAYFAYHGYHTQQARLADKQEQEQQLQAANRQNALEKALLVAMSGDLDAAEKAIQHAERQGVSTGQVRLLRGELAYYRGQVKEAIEHLQMAVKLLPVEESAGARGLLVVAYSYAMRNDESARELRALEPIQPVTVEDFLFKGAAVGQWDEEAGLAILDQAVRQRPSSAIARLFRSDALINMAGNRADPKVADQAIEDVQTATRLLAEVSPAARWYSENTYQLAAFVYKFAGLEDKYRAAKAMALKEAEGLEPFKHLPDAAAALTYADWYFGKTDRRLDDLRRMTDGVSTPLMYFTHAAVLSWRGSQADLLEVRRLLERSPDNTALVVLNCLAAAELDGKEAALELYARETSKKVHDYYKVYLDGIPMLLGRADLTKAASSADRKHDLYFRPMDQAFYNALLDYLAGVETENALLKSAEKSQRNICRARYFFGLTRLAEGDRKGAREQFDKALNTSCPNILAYDLCIILSARMDRDATWPPWIPLKK
jgi:serine/threonine protein kinase